MANLGNGTIINQIDAQIINVVSPSGITISALNFDAPAQNLFEASFEFAQISKNDNYDFGPKWGASLWLMQD